MKKTLNNILSSNVVCGVKFVLLTIVTIATLACGATETSIAESSFFRFESRPWAEALTNSAFTNSAIVVEGGRLKENITWYPPETHLIINAVYVPKGITLTISAGTIIKFCEGTFIKVEDGGMLNIIGEEGQDVILTIVTDDSVGEKISLQDSEWSSPTDGIIIQSSAATFTDNGWLQFREVDCNAYSVLILHDTTVSRSAGKASLPITVSGPFRNQSFWIDWEATDGSATYGNDYTLSSGKIAWTKSGEGTKYIEIPIVEEHITGTNTTFLVRMVVHGTKADKDTATVTITELLDNDEVELSLAESSFIRFESRLWAEEVMNSAFTNAAIIVEGGRLKANTTWDPPETHLILNSVYVPKGITLTISAGTVIKFCEGTFIKVEDGGMLNIIGEEGQDVILTTVADDSVGEKISLKDSEWGSPIDGIIVQSSAATFTDNGWLEFREVDCNAYSVLTLHDTTVSRSVGKAFLPITVSGPTRNQSFWIDWEATDESATYGNDYTLSSGKISWTKSSEGTKYIEIPIVKEHIIGTNTSFFVKMVVHGTKADKDTATITIDELWKWPEIEFVNSCVSSKFTINEGIKRQPFFFNEVEIIQYSGRWQTYNEKEARKLMVKVTNGDKESVLQESDISETGSFEFVPRDCSIGYNTLKHEILDTSGEVLASMQKGFTILDPEKAVLHTGELSQNETWSADKVHVIYGSFVIPSGRTLTIASGAIVKFCAGASLDISSGATCIANGAIFTHVNDDTVGGDTLGDGLLSSPMDEYDISGDLNYDVDTEFRFLTQLEELSGTISTDLKLKSNKTYVISDYLIVRDCTLTIPPGTVLKMDSGASIEVDNGATLNALGTRAAPIIITSIKDDTYNGDTNGDGDATAPQPGDWDIISCSDGKIYMEYTSVLYGGSSMDVFRLSGGVISFNNSTLANAYQYAVDLESGNFSMTNSIFRDFHTAFRHWSTSFSCVNSIFYDMTYLSNNGGQNFKNCIIVKFTTALCWWEDNCTYGNCVIWNPADIGPQNSDKTGMNGNIWGDPLFLDPENGDFRIPANSPCVDAADNDFAPECDYYGQPRVTLTPGHEGDKPAADIGIYEVMPSDAMGKVDFIPMSVVAETNAIPGETISVEWEIKNGGIDAINGSWRDTISLVTSYGKEITLGDCVIRGNIAKGETLSCSGVFIVPALNEGTYYPKVNLNSYHDFFEGMLSTNNVLIGKQPINIVLEGSNPNEPQEGTIKPGTPTVIKLHFDETDENRMIRFNLPAGVKVSWGFGFMPDGSSSSSFATSGDQDLVFLVPEGATDVYIVLESDNPAAYKYSSENSKMVITSASPSTLPSSGTTTLTITGGGFGEKNTITLVHSSGNVELGEYDADASGNIYATVDCSLLRAGTTYSLKVATEEVSATLSNAVTVTGVAPFVDLVATLDAPANVRQGRTTVVYIDYVNKGNIDLPAPVFEIISNGQIFTVDGIKYTNSVKVVGLSKDAPVGMLHPNEQQRFGVTVTIMSDNVQWVLKSYHAGQDSAKTTRFSLRELYNDDWVIYHETEDTELLSKLRTAAGSKWADFYTNFGLWLSSVEPNIVDYQKLKGLFGCYQYFEAKQKINEIEEINDENTKTSSVEQNDNVDDDYTIWPNNGCSHDKYTCGGRDSDEWKKINKLDGTVWKWCPKGHWVLTVNVKFEKNEYKVDDIYETIDTNKPTYIICHGHQNQISTPWVYEMGKALYEKFKGEANVLAVNWGDGADWPLPGGKKWFLSFGGSAEQIPQTVEAARNSLQALGIVPENTMFIGHSHGGHVAANIINEFFKGKEGKFWRFVGLDTSTNDNGVHFKNTMKSEEWIPTISKKCTRLEFYKSSWDMSLEEKNEIYGDWNFVILDGDNIKLNENYLFGCLHGFMYFGDNELKRHSYAHDWFLDTIKDEDKYKNLGFNFVKGSWNALAGKDIETPDKQHSPNCFSGIIRDDVLELVRCRKTDSNGQLETPWRYQKCAIENQKNTNGQSMDALFAAWTATAEVEIQNVEIPDIVESGDGIDVGYINNADNISVDYDALYKIELPWDGGVIDGILDSLLDLVPFVNLSPYEQLEKELSTIKAWLVDLEGLRERNNNLQINNINDLTAALIKIPEAERKNYYKEVDTRYKSLFGLPKPGGESKEFTIRPWFSNNLFGEDRPLAYEDENGERKSRQVLMVLSVGDVNDLSLLDEMLPNDLYKENNFVIKEVMAEPGWLKATICYLPRLLPFVNKNATELVELSGGEVIKIDAASDGSWSIVLDSSKSESMVEDATVIISEFSLPDIEGKKGIINLSNEGYNMWRTQVVGKLPSEIDEDGNPIYEGERYTVQLRIYTDTGLEDLTTCILDVRYPLDDNEGKDEDSDSSFTPHSCDPNEMSGPLGVGDPETERFVRPGELLTYTVYFENVTNATASAQEVRVTNPLNEYLDWSTFEMDEIVFNNQIDLGLAGKQSGTSEVAANGTNYNVRTQLELDKEKGEVKWYMRIVDPSTETGWPDDILVGFLPPNDETYRGEGHLSYRIKVREDAPAGVTINNSATIVFDYNDPIETDPAWWNKVAKVNTIEIEGGTNVNLVVGLPFGELPVPEERKGWIFIGWFTGPDGTGRQITEDSLVEEGDTALYQYWERERHDLDQDDETQVVTDVYNGYLYDPNNYTVMGSISINVMKPKNDNAKVSGTIVMAGGIRTDIKGSMPMSAGHMETTTKSGKKLTLDFSSNGLIGKLDELEIDGSRNVFVSKQPADQAAANSALASMGGVYTVAWEDGTGYAFASVTVGKKGVVKATGFMANGVKFSASGQLLLGKEENCVNLVSKSKKAPLAFNLWLTPDEPVEPDGLNDSAISAKLIPLMSGSSFICDYLANPVPVTIQGNKWTMTTSKDTALKLSYKDKTGLFKGSFKVNKQKAIVNGVVVDGVGYGSAVMKNAGFKPVIINSVKEE